MSAVLSLAGQTRLVPRSYEYPWHAVNGRPESFVLFKHAAPSWLIKLAGELTKSSTLASQILGPPRLRSGGFGDRDAKVRRLPIALRAKVIKAAAENPMTRELLEDDKEAAVRIIKDVW